MASRSKSGKQPIKSKSPKDAQGSQMIFITDYSTSQTYRYLKSSKDTQLVGAEIEQKWERYQHCFDKLTEIFKAGEIEGIKYTADNEKYLDVKIITKNVELEVRIQHKDLYLIGFKKVHPKKKKLTWYELRTGKDRPKIDGSEYTGYSGNYKRMRCDREQYLDYEIFEAAVDFIAMEPEPCKWIKQVVIVIKTLCESLRFNRVRDHFLKNSKSEFTKDKNENWDRLLNDWSRISKAIWKYHDKKMKNEKGMDTKIIVSPGITFETFEELKQEMLIIKPREKPKIGYSQSTAVNEANLKLY